MAVGLSASGTAGVVVTTGDGGATWAQASVPAGAIVVTSVVCASASDCTAIASDGSTFWSAHSTDFGQTWTAGGRPPARVLGRRKSLVRGGRRLPGDGLHRHDGGPRTGRHRHQHRRRGDVGRRRRSHRDRAVARRRVRDHQLLPGRGHDVDDRERRRPGARGAPDQRRRRAHLGPFGGHPNPSTIFSGSPARPRRSASWWGRTGSAHRRWAPAQSRTAAMVAPTSARRRPSTRRWPSPGCPARRRSAVSRSAATRWPGSRSRPPGPRAPPGHGSTLPRPRRASLSRRAITRGAAARVR